MEEEAISIYPGYSFEKPLHLYVWPPLVILTVLANIIIILILMKKQMRNPTNIALTVIAITDSLTGLVTLPTYIMVYRTFEEAGSYYYPDDYMSDYTNSGGGYHPDNNMTVHGNSTSGGGFGHPDYNMTHNGNSTESGGGFDYPDYNMTHTSNSTESDGGFDYQESNMTHYNNRTGNSSFPMSYMYDYAEESAQSAFMLTPLLCEWFMISKLFLSQSFHTMSIWLTVLLGIQRCCYVKFPFASQRVFTIRNTLVACAVIFVLAPILHIYHVLAKKHTKEAMCEWSLGGCSDACAYLWVSLLLKQIVPCVLLIIATTIFIISLVRGTQALQGHSSSMNNVKQRNEDNRRISLIVTVVMIVFLIPEIPYGLFLLYAVIAGHAQLDMDRKTNRQIHAAYEILTVISFHSNFWIYTILNRRFRNLLLSTFSSRFRRLTRRLSSFASSRAVSSDASRTTGATRSCVGTLEMSPLKNNKHLQSSSASEQDNSKTLESKVEGSVDNSASV